MGGMTAADLLPGDVFTVEQPDPESPVRVCLTNDREKGLRFGFPNKPDYWCHMGGLVEVALYKEKSMIDRECDQCENKIATHVVVTEGDEHDDVEAFLCDDEECVDDGMENVRLDAKDGDKVVKKDVDKARYSDRWKEILGIK